MTKIHMYAINRKKIKPKQCEKWQRNDFTLGKILVVWDLHNLVIKLKFQQHLSKKCSLSQWQTWIQSALKFDLIHTYLYWPLSILKSHGHIT